MAVEVALLTVVATVERQGEGVQVGLAIVGRYLVPFDPRVDPPRCGNGVRQGRWPITDAYSVAVEDVEQAVFLTWRRRPQQVLHRQVTVDDAVTGEEPQEVGELLHDSESIDRFEYDLTLPAGSLDQEQMLQLLQPSLPAAVQIGEGIGCPVEQYTDGSARCHHAGERPTGVPIEEDPRPVWQIQPPLDERVHRTSVYFQPLLVALEDLLLVWRSELEDFGLAASTKQLPPGPELSDVDLGSALVCRQ